MKLNPLMTFRANLRQPMDIVGSGPYGVRQIAEVVGGAFEGERLKGTIVTPGADWILIDPSGLGHLDVRATLKTDDDALIYVQYPGIIEFNDKVAPAVDAGSETAFGDAYFMTQPRFETGSADYAWLNSIVAVAEGRLTETGVEYRVYECLHD